MCRQLARRWLLRRGPLDVGGCGPRLQQLREAGGPWRDRLLRRRRRGGLPPALVLRLLLLCLGRHLRL